MVEDLGRGWIRFYMDNYEVMAQVFSEGSKHGINNGPISKLCITNIDTNEWVVNYDRGWDVYPDNDYCILYENAIGQINGYLGY